jgi:hypothetical protein
MIFSLLFQVFLLLFNGFHTTFRELFNPDFGPCRNGISLLRAYRAGALALPEEEVLDSLLNHN